MLGLCEHAHLWRNENFYGKTKCYLSLLKGRPLPPPQKCFALKPPKPLSSPLDVLQKCPAKHGEDSTLRIGTARHTWWMKLDNWIWKLLAAKPLWTCYIAEFRTGNPCHILYTFWAAVFIETGVQQMKFKFFIQKGWYNKQSKKT